MAIGTMGAHDWVYENPDLARCNCGWTLRKGLMKLTREEGPEFWREVEGGAPVLVRRPPPCAETNEPIGLVNCDCGWARPLIAVTLADGSLPREDYRVRYDCPVCGRAHKCGEIPKEQAAVSPRAANLARS